MALAFQKLIRLSDTSRQVRNTVCLVPSIWDDFGHKTLFNLIVFDDQGNEHIIGSIKIGFVGQDGGWTKEEIPEQFEALSEFFYSLGQDSDYYENLVKSLSQEMVINILTALGDVVHDPIRCKIAENEPAFKTSLLRSVNKTSIEDQFRRILQHEAQLTEYNFFYEKNSNKRYSGIRVEFSVEPNIRVNALKLSIIKNHHKSVAELARKKCGSFDCKQL